MNEYSYNRRDLLVMVAKLYYIEGFSQEEISRKVHMSRSNISRILKSCVEEKIVEFRINDTSSLGMELQKQIKELFDLENVIVTPADPNPEKSKANVGKAAAQYLESVLRDGMLLGVSWGTTLYYLVQNFKPASVYKIDVIQLIGGTGAKSEDTDGQELAKNIARSFLGDCYVLQAPLYVKSKVLKDLLMEEPQINQHFKMFDRVDAAAIGIGSNIPELSASYRSGYTTKEEAEQWLKHGAVGDICGHKIDINGNECSMDLSERFIGISLEQLKKIPLVIGVASGSEKTSAIIAGLRGKYLNAIVIDEAAAQGIINAEKHSGKLKSASM